MKKLIAILMILTLAIGMIPAVQADDDGFLFELEKVIQGGEVYWARGITGIWITLGSDEGYSARFTGVYDEGDTEPECTWSAAKDGEEQHIIVHAPEGKDYQYTMSDDSCRLVYQGENDRQLVFILRGSSQDDDKQPENITNTTIDSTDLMVKARSFCPLDLTEWDDVRIHYLAENANCVITFTTKYGNFLYVMDSITGELADKHEPDIDAVRQQEGFTEGIDSIEAQRIAEDASGVDILAISDREIYLEGDAYKYSFNSPYGTFFYTIDAKTGKITDRVEPDKDAARSQEGFVDPITVDEAQQIAEAACPVDFTEIIDRKVETDENGLYIVTLYTNYGDCIYQIDPVTRTVTVMQEPDVDAARQAGGGAPLNLDQILTIAEAACPVPFSLLDPPVISQVSDNVYSVTMTSGDYVFVYTIDALTGTITDQIVPDDYVAPEEARDIYGEAIDAAAAVIPGYDFGGEIVVGEAEAAGDRIVTVTIDWNGQHYEYHYSANERKLID